MICRLATNDRTDTSLPFVSFHQPPPPQIYPLTLKYKQTGWPLATPSSIIILRMHISLPDGALFIFHPSNINTIIKFKRKLYIYISACLLNINYTYCA